VTVCVVTNDSAEAQAWLAVRHQVLDLDDIAGDEVHRRLARRGRNAYWDAHRRDGSRAESGPMGITLPQTALLTRARTRMMYMGKRLLVAFAAALFGSLLTDCAGVPARLRRHTYPPNFRYIDRTQLHSAMWQLADTATALDRVMRQPGVIDTARRAEIKRLLEAMLATTGTLQTQGRPTNHPLISEHLEEFERDLVQARTGVEADPPNYYLVGTVSGACLTCHSPE
jgi:hypothetical protein